MLNIKRKFVTLFVAIFSMILCFGSLTACGSNETQNNNLPEPIYTQAKLQLEYEECVMGAGDVAEISASAHARIGNGNYVTSVTGFTYKSDNNAVATVDENGLIHAQSEGDVTITVEHKEYGVEKSMRVQVLSPVTIDVSENRGFRTYGRAQNSENGLCFVNPASGFEVIFKGTELKCKIQSLSNTQSGKNYLRVVSDEKSEVVEISQNGDEEPTLVSDLSAGIHKVSVYKMLGEEDSQVILKDILSDGVFYNPPKKSNLKISVYGDSAVAGVGLTAESDATASYVFKAAQKLNADIEIMSTPNVSLWEMKDAWNKFSVNSQTSFASAGADTDIAIIDLGANDVSNINGNSYGITEFIECYKNMIDAITAANPAVKVICCYGITPHSKAMVGAIERVVKSLENDEKENVYALCLARADEKALDVGYEADSVCHNKNSEILYNAIKELADGSKLPTVKYDTEKQDIHVIMMGGQSNMEGNSHFRYLIGNDDFEEYKNGFSGIKMSYANHETHADDEPYFQPVRLGFGTARYPSHYWDTTSELADKAAQYGYSGTALNDTFGPDIGIAKVLHDNGYDNKVALIKFAIGGTYFYPRGNGDNRTWAAPNGTLYKAYVTYVKACLAELSETYNVYLDAMFWMQGESDTQSQEAVDAYESNMTQFVRQLRVDFAEYNPDFMFYDAFINWEWENERPDMLNDIKEKLANDNIYYRNIQSKGLKYNTQPIGNIDYAHYDADDEIKLGKLFAQAYIKDFPVV